MVFDSYIRYPIGMARAWDAQGKSTVHIPGQAIMVLGR